MIRSPRSAGHHGALPRRRLWAVAWLAAWRNVARAALLAPLALLATCGPAVDSELRASIAAAPAKPASAPSVPARFTEFAFIANDGAYLPLRRWVPAGPVKAVILALHGFNDYSNAFDAPAKAWAARGIATYAYDQRGFGGAPRRGQWPGAAQLAYDAITASRILRVSYPRRPVYLLGESMGGAVATLAMTGAVNGVAVNSPGMPAVAAADGVILSAPAVWGRATMDLLPKLALFAGIRLFPTMTLTGSGLRILASDNLPMLRALARDPMILRGARVDAIFGLVNLMDDALEAAPRLRAPTLLLYGAHDQVIPRRPIETFVAQLPSDAAGEQRLAYYPHGYHLLLRDLEGATVADDIAQWVLDRAAPLPSHADGVAAIKPWPPVRDRDG
jgi:acylglycerol lipase